MSGSFTKRAEDTAPTGGRDRAGDANATTARPALGVRSAYAIRSPRAAGLPFACCDVDRPRPRWSTSMATSATSRNDVVNGVGVFEAIRASVTVAKQERASRQRRGAYARRQFHHVVKTNDRWNLDHDRSRPTHVRILRCRDRLGATSQHQYDGTSFTPLNCRGSKVAFKRRTRLTSAVPQVGLRPTSQRQRLPKGSRIQRRCHLPSPCESANTSRRAAAGTANDAATDLFEVAIRRVPTRPRRRDVAQGDDQDQGCGASLFGPPRDERRT